MLKLLLTCYPQYNFPLAEHAEDFSSPAPDVSGAKQSQEDVLSQAKAKPVVQGYNAPTELPPMFIQTDLPIQKSNFYMEKNERKKSFNQPKLIGVRHYLSC